MDIRSGLLCIRDTARPFRIFDINLLSSHNEFAGETMRGVETRVSTTVEETDELARMYHAEEMSERSDVNNQYPDLPSSRMLQFGELGDL
jgi:hypothetical protein